MPYLISLLISIIVFLLYNFTQTLSIWLHFVLSPFVHGVSRFKIDFTLLYFALLSVLALTPWKLRSKPVISRLKKLSYLSILSAFLMGFLSFIFFIRRFSLPIEKYVYHFKGHYHSINYFGHIHTSKTALFHLLNFLGLDFFNEICDTGLVFANYVNPWILLVLSLSVIVAFICLTLLTKPILEKWSPEKRIFVLIAYAFAGAHILKCSVDGGVFSCDLLPSLIALHLLFSSHDAPSLANIFKKWRMIYFLVIAAYIGLCSFISIDDALLHIPIGFGFMASVYFILFLPLFSPKFRSLKFLIMLLICLSYISVYWSVHGLNHIKALYGQIREGDRVIKFNYSSPKNLPTVADYTGKMAGKRLIDVYQELNNNPLRNRDVAILKAGEEKDTGYIFVLKIIKREGNIKLQSNKFMEINRLSPYKDYGENAYLLEVSFNPYLSPTLWSKDLSILLQNNRYCVLYLLNHYFLQSGITEYVIIPLYFFNPGQPE